MKSTKTFAEEYNFLKTNIPTAVEDHDFRNLPLPPNFVENLFGESIVESQITKIDIDDLFNSILNLEDHSEKEMFFSPPISLLF